MLVLVGRIRLLLGNLQLRLHFSLVRINTRYKKSLPVFLDIVHALATFLVAFINWFDLRLVRAGSSLALLSTVRNLRRTSEASTVSLWRQFIHLRLSIGGIRAAHRRSLLLERLEVVDVHLELFTWLLSLLSCLPFLCGGHVQLSSLGRHRPLSVFHFLFVRLHD